MKKLLIATSFALFGLVSAHAADLPYSKAPLAQATYNWSGYYAGVTGGGVWGYSDTSVATSIPGLFGIFNNAINDGGSQRLNSPGFTVGITSGYNMQFGNILLGIEDDFSYFRLSKSGSKTTALGITTLTTDTSVSTDWMFTLRPRIGVLVTPEFLLYATGGLALTNLQGTYSMSSNLLGIGESANYSKFQVGWTAGAGAEYALRNGWSFKTEYLYVDFGKETATSNNLHIAGFFVPGATFTHSVDLVSHVARAGFNYKFGGPVATSY